MSPHSQSRQRRIAAAVLVALSSQGCDHRQQAAPPPPPPPEVVTVAVQPRKVVLTTELPGRTAAYVIAEIRPQVNGLVQKRLFTEGSDVKADELLYEIDPAPFKAAYDNAAANLEVMKKTADRARSALASGQAAITRQKATLSLACTSRQRLEDLLKDKAVSTADRDAAVTAADVAEAALKEAEAMLASDQHAVSMAEAGIKQADAALETARINQAYTRITAPISGRIGKSTVTSGAIVTAYQPVALATIQQLDPIYVDVPQSTADLLRLRRRLETSSSTPGGTEQNKVSLILEDGTTYPQEGVLQFRDISVDSTTGSVILRAVFPNQKGHLLPGMFVRAVVKEGVNEKAILVPQQAVSRDPRGVPLAMVLGADGKVAQKMLVLDRAIGDQWLVTTGLAAGDRVIIEGMQKIRPGGAAVEAPAGAGGAGPAARPASTTQPSSAPN